MDLKQRIIGLNLLGVSIFAVVLGVLAAWGLDRTINGVVGDVNDALVKEKRAYIQDQVDVACAVIKTAAADGSPEARRQAARLAATLRYAGGSGYFFAYEPDGGGGWRFAFHGTKDDLWGKAADLSKPDVKGFGFRQALVDAGRKGGDFVKYHYEKPTSKEILGKLAFARPVPELGWVVVGGIYVDDIEATVGAVKSEVHEARTRLLVQLGGAAAALLLIVGTVSWWLARRTAGPLLVISERVRETSREMTLASDQIASSSEALAQSSTQQAADLQESTAALTELSSQAEANGQGAEDVRDQMTDAAAVIRRTEAAMADMVQTMSGIKSSSDEISTILKTIEEIAFQTNLLALNAAVEAARAGEHGKGFAVVAEEVRNLAGRSAEAAKDTADLIATNTDQAERGQQITTRVAEEIREVAAAASQVTERVGEIATASQQQSQGTGQISEAIHQMEETTQQVAAHAEESAASSREVASQAQSLQRVVEEMGELLSGRRGQRSPAVAVAPPATPRRPAPLRRQPAPARRVEVVLPLDEEDEAFV